MSGFGISKASSGGTPTSGDIVYFDKLTPTTAGVIFSPNTPATSGLLYISSVDASVWIWDGTQYISYSNDAVVLAVTYSEFNTLITTSQLDIDKKYLITDYQTIYDQPDFSALNTPKAVVSTLTGSVEPLIVTPVAVNKISNVALSTVYPNDAILYDWTFVATEIMGASAKGRITQRTDTSDNTVSYDSRNVLYKRYDNGSGEYTIYWDNGNASNSAIPTFANLNNNYNINFIVVDTTLANTNSTFLLPNTLFYGSSSDIKAGNLFYNNTFTNLTKSSFKDNCNNNILSGGSSNNVKNNFSTNTINIGFSNNNIGDEFQNNTVGVDFQFNNIGYNFYQNTIGATFQYNSVANEFMNNIIGNDVYSNTFGDYCFSNNLADGFGKNTIGSTFQNNTTTSIFQQNIIETGASGNTFATTLNNNIGVGFVTNTLGNNFNNNFIGNGFGSNIIGIGFLSNKFGNNCIYNSIGFDFIKNEIGAGFTHNTVGNTINDLFIQNNYTSQTIASGTNTKTDISGLTTGFVKNTNGVLQDIPFGAASQYVRGDGTLASFPDIAGGGGGQVYYCNGGTSEGTIGGNSFYQLSTGAVIGTGVDFTSGTVDDVVFANFITDIGKPTQEIVPAGVWIFQCYFSASAANTQVYATVEVYDGATFTVLSTSLIEDITGNSTIDLYTFTCAVPEYTPLTTSDRIAIRFYPTNLAGSHTITLHTQDSHLSSIQTTFTTGVASLDGLTASAQYFQTGTSGTDFNIATSGVDTHVFNIPTASATNRGALSTADWNTFNGKVGGTGTTNYLPKFSASSTVTNSQIFDNGTNVGIGTITPASTLHVFSNSNPSIRLQASATNIWELFTSSSQNDIAIRSSGTRGVIYLGVFATSNVTYIGSSGNLTVSSSVDSAFIGGGNVGIGTNTPTEKLEVSGKTKTTTFQMTTAPSAGYVMTSDASGNGSWSAAAGGLTYFSEAQNTTAPNATVNVDSLTAVASTTNADFAIVPKGTGALTRHIPDGIATGGNKRGQYATDLQTARSSATQVASGDWSFVGGGSSNTASGQYSAAFGVQTTASGNLGSFSAGWISTASGQVSVAMGFANVASGLYSTAFGNANTSSGQTTFTCNESNVASGSRSFVAGYNGNDFGIINRQVFSSALGTNGDSQKSTFILNKRTTDTTPTVLTVQNNAIQVNTQLTLQNNNSIRFKGTIIGRQSGSTNTSAWDIDGIIQRGVGVGTTTLLISNVNVVQNTPAWGTPTLTANTTLGCLTVSVIGASATNIQWTCAIDTTEVIYA